MNFAYNHCYDLHRFHNAVVAVQERKCQTWIPESLDNSTEGRNFRCSWVASNADLVAAIHVLRVELQVRYVMQQVVSCTAEEPFLFWLRF